MELSIIIPSFRRADLLKYGLKSLSKQTITSDFEVIVLNDGVHDNTEQVCESFKDQLDIRYIFTGHRNHPEPVWRIPGYAINIGAKQARGKYMIIMCPEMYSLDDTIQDMIDQLRRRPKSIVITDGKDDQDETFLKAVKAKDADEILRVMYESMPKLDTKFPFLLGINTSEFLGIGGYDEDFIGNCWDDQDIIMRLQKNGNSYVKLDRKIVHLYHSRLRYEKDKIKELWDYNKNIYDKKFGTIKRNVGKDWGSLAGGINKRPPNELEIHFTNIYEKNTWNGKESKSGTGSDTKTTANMRPQLTNMINDLQAKTMLDLPCGDFNWMKEIISDLHIEDYTGGDIIRPMIRENQIKYGGMRIVAAPKFMYFNLIEDVPPKVDVILCRDGLVHFSYKTIMKVIKNFIASGSTFLITTHFIDTEREYPDITDGKWHPLNLTLPPFNFPPPFKVIIEGCTECDGIYKDKALGLWRLHDLKSCLEPTPKKTIPLIPGQPNKDNKRKEFIPEFTDAISRPSQISITIPNKKKIKMKVAHIHPWWDSAGVGIIHTEMMNKYTDIEVRHIVTGTTCLDHKVDLILGPDNDKIRKVLKESDVLHFNTFWYDDPQLIVKFPWENYIKGKKIIFHMHGGTICFDYKKLSEISKVATVVTCSPLIPKFMPFTTWVPNIIPIDDLLYQPKEWESEIPFKFLFMVNHDHNKGRAEIEWLFHKLNTIYGYTILFESWLHKYSYDEGLKQRQAFDVVIDNITQGFIGMVGWETLCQEQVCLARLSPEVMANYTKLGNGTPPPIVNVSGIDELAKEILDLSGNAQRVKSIQKKGREWMKKYYNPERLCKLWEKRYLGLHK